jgi:hypothetical protein
MRLDQSNRRAELRVATLILYERTASTDSLSFWRARAMTESLQEPIEIKRFCGMIRGITLRPSQGES